jgi:hypothetical protein
VIRRCLLALALLVFGAAAQAHKASDAYLQIDVGNQALAVRWDIALRDLDVALGLDANDDGQLSWAEVKTAWPRIQGYALPRLSIAGCPLHVNATALERRDDGAYAVMFLSSECVLTQAPAIMYSLLREVDATHRGIAKVSRIGQPMSLMMLTPVDVAPAASIAGAASPEATGFIREGMLHILTGYDHVLFLLCLLLPSVMRRTPVGWRSVDKLSQAVWPVVGIVSAFTVAHSITLALAATKAVALSPGFIEPAIAVTIILAALDNVWPIFPVRRVVVTFCFGLIHGFGFAGVLAELNLPAWSFAAALLQFNIGLELGQLLIVVSVTALLFLLRRRPRYRGLVIRGGSLAAMLVGALWLIERTANVSILPM